MRGQMTDNVVDFGPVIRVAVENGPFDFDAMFESLKGHGYDLVLVLAIDQSNGFEWYGNLDRDEANFFMDRVKAKFLEDEALT